MNIYIDDTDLDINDISLFNGFQVVDDSLPIGLTGVLIEYEVCCVDVTI
jgi:hypothetical protein